MSTAPIPQSIPVSVTVGDITRVIRRELSGDIEEIKKRLTAIEDRLAAIEAGAPAPKTKSTSTR